MNLYKQPWQSNTIIRRTYLQALWVCIIWAYFISNFLQNWTEVLAKTYDTVRIRQLDTIHSAMVMDWGFAWEQEIVCGSELNKRLHSVLPWYTSDPVGITMHGCDDGFAFVPFAGWGGGVLVTVVQDNENANYNYSNWLKRVLKKQAVNNICSNGSCDPVEYDDEYEDAMIEHAWYYGKIISL